MLAPTFLTEEILAKIVRETKRYAENFFLTNRDNIICHLKATRDDGQQPLLMSRN